MAMGESGIRGRTDEAQSVSVHGCIEEGTLRVSALALTLEPEYRTGFARKLVHAVVAEYWQRLQEASGRDWSLLRLPVEIGTPLIAKETRTLAESLGHAAAKLDVANASYAIGTLYTSMMPDGMQSRYGAYYTPPALCEVLLDMAAEAGVVWRSARVLDPACGGGAFLVPVAQRMVNSLGNSASPEGGF